jgi:membrane protein DedA with SNARE-associated domain
MTTATARSISNQTAMPQCRRWPELREAFAARHLREQPIQILQNYDPKKPRQPVASGISRELTFLVSHSIHHYALIGVILRLNGILVPQQFGFAPSTIFYLKGLAGRTGDNDSCARELMLQFIAIAASTFISEDLACIAAGSLAAASELSLTSAIAASLVGIVRGRFCCSTRRAFWAVRAILRFRIAARYLSPREAAQRRALVRSARQRDRGAEPLCSRHAATDLCRSWRSQNAGAAFLSAGSSLPPPVWTPALVAASYYSGASFARQLSEKSSPRFWLAIGLAFFVMWVLLAFARSLFTFKGRRLLYSKWQRLLRWEFWPMWVLYVPVGIYIFYLGIRHRSLTAGLPRAIPESPLRVSRANLNQKFYTNSAQHPETLAALLRLHESQAAQTRAV